MAFVKDLIDKVFYGAHGEAMRYLFFGGLNVVVTWLSYAALVVLGIDINVSNIVSWILGVLFAVVMNKIYVFEARSMETRTVGVELASFFGGRILTGVIAWVGFPLLYGLGMNQSLFGVDGFPAKILTSFIEIVLNYVISKYLVFKKRRGRPILRGTRSGTCAAASLSTQYLLITCHYATPEVFKWQNLNTRSLSMM